MIVDQAVATSLAIEEIGQVIVFDAPFDVKQSACARFRTAAPGPFEQVPDNLLAGALYDAGSEQQSASPAEVAAYSCMDAP